MNRNKLLGICIIFSVISALLSVAANSAEHRYTVCPNGHGKIVIFKDNMKVNGSVTVTNSKTGYKAVRQLPIKSTPDECANEVLKAAYEVGIEAEWGGPGSGSVRVCGKRNIVSVFGNSIDSQSF